MSAVEIMAEYRPQDHRDAHQTGCTDMMACPECQEVGSIHRLGRCMTCVDCGWSACTR